MSHTDDLQYGKTRRITDQTHVESTPLDKAARAYQEVAGAIRSIDYVQRELAKHTKAINGALDKIAAANAVLEQLGYPTVPAPERPTL